MYFYVSAIVLALYSVLLYALFRGGIYDHLRESRISKSFIRKSRKGLKNYWLYHQLNKSRPMGALYYLNAAFLILLIIYLPLSVLFGKVGFMEIPVAIAAALLFFCEIPAIFFFTRADAIANYGRPFVFFARRREYNGYYSSFLFLTSLIIPAALVWVCIKEAFFQ